jgi:hypothetical protein
MPQLDAPTVAPPVVGLKSFGVGVQPVQLVRGYQKSPDPVSKLKVMAWLSVPRESVP